MFTFSLKFSGSLLTILFAVATTALKDSDRSIPSRFQRQSVNAESPTLEAGLISLQQLQQGGQFSGSGQNSGNNNQNVQNVTTRRTPANLIFNENTLNEAQCIRNCPATNQWNPVCGTDNISYGNVNKLRCAQQCGRQVSLVYNGSCVTTPPP